MPTDIPVQSFFCFPCLGAVGFGVVSFGAEPCLNYGNAAWCHAAQSDRSLVRDGAEHGDPLIVFWRARGRLDVYQ
jgi:hypothetical protein